MAERTQKAKAILKPYGPKPTTKVTKVATKGVAGASAAGTRPYYDDEKNYYIAIPDHHMSKKFLIKKVIGQGTFGRVVNCYDTYTNQACAVKVIRSVEKYRKAAEVEMEVLQYISTIDNLRETGCVFMNDAIDFRNHICISFPLYGESLFKVLQVRKFVGLPFEQTVDIMHQILCATEFLHGVRLIHTDLKPENILVRQGAIDMSTSPPSLNSSEIIIIDFSSAHWSDKRYSKEVSTRHYRAPEIILDMGWSFPCDLWSAGCIMFELLTGQVLFQTHENIEHLSMMEHVVGKFAYLWVEHSLKKKLFKLDHIETHDDTQVVGLNWPEIALTEKSIDYVKRFYRPLPCMLWPYLDFCGEDDPILEDTGVAVTLTTEETQLEQRKAVAREDASDWYDLIIQMLVLRPHYRTRAPNLLSHPIFTKRLEGQKLTRVKKGWFSTADERREWLADSDRLQAYLRVARPSVNSFNAIV